MYICVLVCAVIFCSCWCLEEGPEGVTALLESAFMWVLCVCECVCVCVCVACVSACVCVCAYVVCMCVLVNA